MKNLLDDPALLISSEFNKDLPSSHLTSTNSFLVEVDFNADISESLRKEINNRYNRSRTNKTYKFPRVTQPVAIKPNKSSEKTAMLRTKHSYFREAKYNRSLSPYESIMNRTYKSKSPNRSELGLSSKTPLPLNASFKAKQRNRLPIIMKNSVEVGIGKGYFVRRKISKKC
jgi:hypothetical protein